MHFLVVIFNLFDQQGQLLDNIAVDMKKTALLLSLAIAILVSPLTRAETQPLSSSAQQKLRQNCVSAQVSLQRVQQAEKPTRINRGYLYDRMLKLMTSFNSRVAFNNIDSPELFNITTRYQESLKSFAAEYTAYDNSLSDLIAFDCAGQPSQFYDTLVETRRLRSEFTKTINTLDSLLNDYRTNVDSVKKVVEVTS